MKKLDGKVAVVTGGGFGIGRATAFALAKEGAIVAVCDIDGDAAQATAEAVGGGSRGYQVDISDEQAMRSLVDTVVADHQVVDIVTNIAGIGMLPFPSIDFPLEEYRRMMGVNFWGTVYSSLFFLPHLEKRPEANLVNLTSVASFFAVGGESAYNSSKYAARGFTETLRMELHDSPVNVSLICPGTTRTSIIMRAANLTDDERQRYQAKFDNVWGTSPERVAARVLRAIKTNKPRVLVGVDTRAMDFITRAIPSHYSTLMAKPVAGFLGKLFGNA